MTHRSGDMCASKDCFDLARPGHDHCAACIADRQAEREITAQRAAVVTAEHEAQVEQQERMSAA